MVLKCMLLLLKPSVEYQMFTKAVIFFCLITLNTFSSLKVNNTGGESTLPHYVLHSY